MWTTAINMNQEQTLRNFGNCGATVTQPSSTNWGVRTQMMQDGMIWLEGDDTGLSSKAMVYAALHIPRQTNNAYPLDPSDLGRCLRMLRELPWAKNALPILAERCPIWASFVAEWDHLAAMMDVEVGIDWDKGRSQASATYSTMQHIIERGRGDM